VILGAPVERTLSPPTATALTARFRHQARPLTLAEALFERSGRTIEAR
jgi:hypothetical protein